MRSVRPRERQSTNQEGMGRLEEWQRHQYDPGYWVGGKIPPDVLGRRPNRLGWVYILVGIMTFISCAVMAYADTFTYYPPETLKDTLLVILEGSIALVPGVVIIIGGISLLRRRKQAGRPGKKDHPRHRNRIAKGK